MLLSRLPAAQLVDISHEVPRHDVLGGALMLEDCVPHFPASAVHLAVIDPGGGDGAPPHRALRPRWAPLRRAGQRPVHPLSREGRRAGHRERRHRAGGPVGHLSRPGPFAPAAAFLAGGGAFSLLGPLVEDPVRLRLPRSHPEGDTLLGECLREDSFGNVLTSIRESDLDGRAVVEVTVAGRRARWVTTYGEGALGELVALKGSAGRLEIAVREGDAARLLELSRGAPWRCGSLEGGRQLAVRFSPGTLTGV